MLLMFYSFCVYGLEKLILTASIGHVFHLWAKAIAPGQHILALIPLLPNLDNLPGSIVRT
jgi:hypothetical protein